MHASKIQIKNYHSIFLVIMCQLISGRHREKKEAVSKEQPLFLFFDKLLINRLFLLHLVLFPVLLLLVSHPVWW